MKVSLYSIFLYFSPNIFSTLSPSALNNEATISCVLYANTNHLELRNEFPVWADRFKQILKKWRTLSNEQKAPYLAKARENRSAIRMKKAQQVRRCFYFFSKLGAIALVSSDFKGWGSCITVKDGEPNTFKSLESMLLYRTTLSFLISFNFHYFLNQNKKDIIQISFSFITITTIYKRKPFPIFSDRNAKLSTSRSLPYFSPIDPL